MLRRQGRDALQYGPIAGPPPFVDLVLAKLGAEGLSVTAQNLLVTVGGSQGIDLVTHLLVDPGDVVIVEAPTFIGALQTFRNAEADLQEVPLDDGRDGPGRPGGPPGAPGPRGAPGQADLHHPHLPQPGRGDPDPGAPASAWWPSPPATG